MAEGNGTGRNPTMPPMIMNATGRGKEETGNVLDEYNPLKTLFEGGDKDIDLRTELNDLQIVQLSRAAVFSDFHKVGMLDKFCQSIMRKSVSKSRKSRKEFVTAFQAANMGEGAESAGAWANMMGRLRS